MEVHELVGLCEERYVTLALFTGVENAGKLRSLATNGALQASLLEPTLVCTYPGLAIYTLKPFFRCCFCV